LIHLRLCPRWSQGISAGLGGKSSFPQRQSEYSLKWFWYYLNQRLEFTKDDS